MGLPPNCEDRRRSRLVDSRPLVATIRAANRRDPGRTHVSESRFVKTTEPRSFTSAVSLPHLNTRPKLPVTRLPPRGIRHRVRFLFGVSSVNGLPSDVKELVRSRTDLVQLVGESVTLHSQRGGRTFKALCPFHDDHNPSMEVNPERQTFRCWVCHKGGDCFSWVMEYEGVGFREALESLARRAGVELPKFPGRRDSDAPTIDKASLYDVLAWAEAEFHRFLLQGGQSERAREYLRSRHFRAETIAEYRLGYHPDSWDWLLQRAAGKFSASQLEAVRLVKARDGGTGYFDYFVDRVLFPIHDERGRCVAFGGRVLPDSRYNEGGKYFNSPESPLFQKSRLIFGLDKARDGIRKSGTAVVMEGYVDCIKAQQSGIKNAVATLGTALTEQHVAFLKRLAERVVLVYDGDQAGKDAAVRAIEKFIAQDVDLRVLTLPDGHDPDEFLDAHGTAAFEALIRDAREAWDVRYRHCVSHFGTGTVAARLMILKDMLGLLALNPVLNGTTKESVLVAGLAQRLGFGESDVRRELREVRGRTAANAATRKVSAGEFSANSADAERQAAIVSVQQRPRKDDLLECELLQILFTAPPMMRWVRPAIGVDDLQNSALRELLAACFDLADHGEPPDFTRVLSYLECPSLKSLAVWIDEQAAARDVAGKLAQDVAQGSDHPPEFVRNALEQLTWRRSAAKYESARGERAGLESQSPLTPEAKAQLARATQFLAARSPWKHVK